MKKAWEGLRCVYCGVNPATTDDEVFAQGFFHKPDAVNEELPKVPACRSCNEVTKSKLDQYAMSVLAFGARHPSALPHVITKGMRRIEENQALRREVAATVGTMWLMQPDGTLEASMTYRADYGKIIALFQMIAKGLMWHERKVYLAPDTRISVMFLPQEDAERFADTITNWKWDKVERSIWNGTISYRGMFGGHSPDIILDPQFSAWEITMLGGIHIAMRDPSKGICTAIRIVTEAAKSSAIGKP